VRFARSTEVAEDVSPAMPPLRQFRDGGQGREDRYAGLSSRSLSCCSAAMLAASRRARRMDWIPGAAPR
jgi:hypothetical protein